MLQSERIVHVEPSAGIVPANLLRLHVQFDCAPKTPATPDGHLFRHLRLETQAGRVVEDAFLEKERWSADGRRLTLLLRPERQLRGWRRDESKLRPVLQEGEVYRLVLEPTLLLCLGMATPETLPTRPTIHTFQAAHPRQAPLDPSLWKLMLPEPGTRDPVVAALPHPVEETQLRSCIDVRDATGASVKGRSIVSTRGACWRFEPEQPWRASPYRLTIHPRLDDGCGNTPVGSKCTRVEVAQPCLERVLPLGPEEQPTPAPALVRS